MPGTIPQQQAPEQTILDIIERAKILEAEGQPARFELMLNRRDRASGFPNSIASLTNATIEHIQEPMRWIPMLCGGGEYTLNVRHASMPGRIGGPIPFSCTTEGPGMQPHPPNPLVTIRADWQGPKLVTPPPPDPATVPGATQQHTNGAVATGQMTTGYGVPSFGVPAPQQSTDRERELQQQLAEMKATAARVEAEARARAELDAMKRDADARVREAETRAETRMRELETRIAALSQQAATPPPPKQDTMQVIQTVFTLAMPLIQQLIQSQHDSRQLMLKMNEEQNRRQLEANEKQHQATMELMRTVQQKPGMSEEMKLLITTLQAQAGNNGGEAYAALMARMAEAMGTVTKSSIAMVETTVDALGGEPDHPAVIAIREGVGALKALMEGNKAAAMKSVKQPQQLPAGQQRPNPASGLTKEEIALINQRRQAQAQARATAGRQVPPKPQQGIPAAQTVRVATPPQGPQRSVAPEHAQAMPQQPSPQQPPPPQAQPATPAATVITFEEPPAAQVGEATAAPVEPQVPVTGLTAEGFPEAQPGTGLSHFQVLAAGVQAMKSPEEVASYFVTLLSKEEPSVKAALEEHDNSPFSLLESVVGGPFIAANMAYFKELGTLIDEKGAAAGVWKDATDEDREADAADEAAEAEEAAALAEPEAQA